VDLITLSQVRKKRQAFIIRKLDIWVSFRAAEVGFCSMELFLNGLYLSLDNGQLDAHLLYFTIRPLESSPYFEHYI